MAEANKKYMGGRETGHCQAMLDEIKFEFIHFSPTLASEVVEETQVVEIKYDEDLKAKYPCPQQLDFVKHLLYTPINLVGFNKLLLCNDGVEKTSFKTRKFAQERCQWIMLPKGGDKRVILRSVLDGKHLSVWCDKGPKQGTANIYVDDNSEGNFEQFYIENSPDDIDSYFLVSVANMKMLQTHTRIKGSCIGDKFT